MSLKPVNPLDVLKAFVAKYPTQKEAARVLGVSAAYLGDMLAGNRDVAPRTLGRLNLERIVVQKRKAS